MDYKLTRLKNGLRVVTVPLPSLESATVTIWVGTGSRYETPRISGISHFLEHMVFKGSKSRPSAQEIAQAVDAIGGEFNAGTSKHWTNFYIKARAEKLTTAFDVLSDMVLNPILRQEDIDREKGVIIEEINMYEDTPMHRIWDIFENLIFKGNPLSRDIIGNKKSVTAIKKNDFVLYRNKHYYPQNLIITVAGGAKESQVLDLSQKYFAGLAKSKRQTSFKEFSPKQKSSRVLLHAKPKEQAHFILGFTGFGMGSRDRFNEAVLAALMGQGMSSRLFTEVREKRGLAYAVKTSLDRYQETGAFATYAGVDPKRVDEAIKVTLAEHYDLVNGKKPITETELTKAKEYIKGHLALSLEDTKSINMFFGLRELTLGEIETPDEVFAGIDKVTADQVLKTAKKVFVPERLNLAVIGPYNKQERFEKLVK